MDSSFVNGTARSYLIFVAAVFVAGGIAAIGFYFGCSWLLHHVVINWK